MSGRPRSIWRSRRRSNRTCDQSRLHALLLKMLGIAQIAVLVNKMDRVGFSAERFETVQRELAAYLAGLGLQASHFIPISARDGDWVVSASPRMAWYEGVTVLEALEAFRPAPAELDRPLRLPVQDVYRRDDKRILVGRLESGRLRVGDEVQFSPANSVARVSSIERWGGNPQPLEAVAGESIGFTLADQLLVERGQVASHRQHAPVESKAFSAAVFWLGPEPLAPGKTYRLRVHTAESDCHIASITGVLSGNGAQVVAPNEVAEVIVHTERVLAVDSFDRLPHTGRFVLLDGARIAGGGLISTRGFPDQRARRQRRPTDISSAPHRLLAGDRLRRNGHPGGVLWLTGLSGAGKSSIAMELERRLFQDGYRVYVLDGDNLRHGLNSDLGFSPEDRVENVRRAGEVAALLADAGVLAIAAFISPYQADREAARAAVNQLLPGGFHEVYVSADLATCESRDPKGLYRKARRGELADFTGISAPYEPPPAPELIVDTRLQTLEQSVELVRGYAHQRLPLLASG